MPDLTQMRRVETAWSTGQTNAMIADGWVLLQVHADGYKDGGVYATREKYILGWPQSAPPPPIPHNNY
jgi:hypothetical protein